MNLLPSEGIKRKILVRKKAKSSLEEKRSVEDLINYGIVVIDKPQGPTSHQVSAYVQRILNIKKSGHSGTLDPNVTGVLVVALERATRIVQILLPIGKEYVAIIHFHKDISNENIKKVFSEFTGKIKQIPPIKSSVRRKERIREIYYLDIMEIDGKDVLFRVGCEAGTYIRKLCHDMGKKVGGAHMAELRRTKVGHFNGKDAITLQDLVDAYHYWTEENNEKYIRHCIRPMEEAIRHLPKIWVQDSTIESLSHGADLALPGISKVETGIKKDDTVAVLTLKGILICLGTARMKSEEMLGEKDIAVKTEKVFFKSL